MEKFGIASGWLIFLLVVFLIWTICWKGIALWKAARRGAFGWFVILLIFNTLGILEILYILFFSKDDNSKPENGSYPEKEIDFLDEKEEEDEGRNIFRKEIGKASVRIV
jgi:methionyl-tRNA synthetase